jgi:predicted GNAT family acetyltransferase
MLIERLHVSSQTRKRGVATKNVYGEVDQCRKAVLIVLALPMATKEQDRTLALPYTAWLQQKQRLAFPSVFNGA